MSVQIPKLLFLGAGNIAQSVMKGIVRSRPDAATRILAAAPTFKNLAIIKETLGCKITTLDVASDCIDEFQPDFVLLCVKPQVLMASISNSKTDKLYQLLNSMPSRCTTLSLLAGIKCDIIASAFNISKSNVVRVMLNTAAEIGSTSVVFYADERLDDSRAQSLSSLFGLIGRAVVRINDESLMDVATGVCGSGIAFFYEMIQTISDISVKNGLGREESTLIAAQLSISAGEMLLNKRTHPYKLRDDVASPAGTTIYGLSNWHEHSTGQKIGQAFQASIDRARTLSAASAEKLNKRGC